MAHYGKRKHGHRPAGQTASTSFSSYRDWSGIVALPVVVAIIFIIQLASDASQLALSPVFGEIPSGLHHHTINAVVLGVGAASMLAAARYGHSERLDAVAHIISQGLAILIPVIQPWLWMMTDQTDLGAVWGPIAVESLTFYPLSLLLSYRAGSILRRSGLLGTKGSYTTILSVAVGGILNTIIAMYSTNICATLNHLLDVNLFKSRFYTHQVIAILIALSQPRYMWSPKVLIFVVAALSVLYAPNSLRTIENINRIIAPLNHTLLARSDSITGHVSVLKNEERGYLMLRCDHSILGGEWLKRPAGAKPSQLREPIYAVFVLLEAVRLVDPPARDRSNPSALIIGLGIGTSATGLIRHGIATTIVELDPTVYQYAKEYFNLDLNHTAHITDAVEFVSHQQKPQTETMIKYDYILHDVFTGGAVPASLFTVEFLVDTKNLLNKNGVIAINYAGDLKLDAALSILKTIVRVFRTCRAFRDDEPPTASSDLKVDFTNMVIFCTPFSSEVDGPHFHKATKADYLNTWIREKYLFPRFEVNLKKIMEEMKPDVQLISASNVGILTEWQKESAVSHWMIMNTVIPSIVWRNY